MARAQLTTDPRSGRAIASFRPRRQHHEHNHAGSLDGRPKAARNVRRRDRERAPRLSDTSTLHSALNGPAGSFRCLGERQRWVTRWPSQKARKRQSMPCAGPPGLTRSRQFGRTSLGRETSRPARLSGPHTRCCLAQSVRVREPQREANSANKLRSFFCQRLSGCKWHNFHVHGCGTASKQLKNRACATKCVVSIRRLPARQSVTGYPRASKGKLRSA